MYLINDGILMKKMQSDMFKRTCKDEPNQSDNNKKNSKHDLDLLKSQPKKKVKFANSNDSSIEQ